MFHSFDGPCYMKNDKYMKNMIAITIFHVFLIFRVVGSIESMQHGYSLDEELNYCWESRLLLDQNPQVLVNDHIARYKDIREVVIPCHEIHKECWFIQCSTISP